MKLKGVIKCPFCGSEKTYVYQHIKVDLWDDDFNKMLNEEYPKDDKLHCDEITYKCKCEEENCNKYFTASLKLKCEVEDVITYKNEDELYSNYFKK